MAHRGSLNDPGAVVTRLRPSVIRVLKAAQREGFAEHSRSPFGSARACRARRRVAVPQS